MGEAAAGPIALAIEGPLAIATLAQPPVNAIDEAWLARINEVLDAASGAAVFGNADGYAMEVEATAMLLASADTQARVRSFLEKQR
jgi:hypothetical protein